MNWQQQTHRKFALRCGFLTLALAAAVSPALAAEVGARAPAFRLESTDRTPHSLLAPDLGAALGLKELLAGKER